MKQEDTRQKILAKALELFSVHGYDAVSVGQIAAAVGIKAPSLYNHFPSKRAIFDAIVEATAAQYEADTDRIDIHVQNARQDIPVFTRITEDGLLEKGPADLFLLAPQRDHQPLPPDDDARAVPLAGARGALFPALCGARDGVSRGDLPQPHRGRGTPGRGRRGDGPLLCGPGHHPLIGICDRQPEREAACLQKLEAHVRLFYRTFQADRNERSEDDEP